MKKNLTTLLLALLALQLNAQKTLDIELGFGIPEMLHIGVRGQLNSQTQLGLYFGTLPSDETTNAIGADFYAHFGKQGPFADRKMWYYRGGFTRTFETQKVNKDLYLFFNNRIGKDIYFSKQAGMSVDLGFTFMGDHTIKNKQETSGWLGGELDLTPSVFPSGSLSFFYRF